MKIARVAQGAVYFLFTIGMTILGLSAWALSTVRVRLPFSRRAPQPPAKPAGTRRPEKQVSGR